MSIQQAFPHSCKVELGQAIHNWTSDTLNMALYTSAANLGPTTTAYTATGEVATGNGYTAGGQALNVNDSGSIDNGVAVFAVDEPVWPTATFTARGALLYNASKSNRAMGVYDFGVDITGQGGDFVVRMPPKSWNQAFWRIA